MIPTCISTVRKRLVYQGAGIMALILIAILSLRYSYKALLEMQNGLKIKIQPRNFSLPYQSKSMSNELLSSLLEEALERATSRKNILLWFPRERDLVNIDSARCGNCVIVTNRSKISHYDTRAVVFHHVKISSKTMPPSNERRRDQYHVWMTGESPSTYYFRRKTLTFEDSYKFNLTMTYRRDSDVYRPYGTIDELTENAALEENMTNIMAKKKRLAIVFVSDCDHVPGAKYRLKLIREIVAAGLQLDTFGSCFSKPVIIDDDGLVKTISHYKFYFAMENSHHCRDYITEKFFRNSLEAGAVPVVWGAVQEDYEAIAPKGSFINMDNFSNPKQLIEYLRYLDKNDTAYANYFKWRWRQSDQSQNDKRATWFCQLCRILHGINIDDIHNPRYNRSGWPRKLFESSMSEREVSSLKWWYFNTEGRECFSNSFKFGQCDKI